MKAQMVKWGKGLAVRIPKRVAEVARLKEGNVLEIEAAEGRVELRRTGGTPTLAKLVSEITPENRYGEITTGPEVGMEVAPLPLFHSGGAVVDIADRDALCQAMEGR